MPMIRVDKEQHDVLMRLATQNGFTLTKLVSIIFDVALLGLPAILRKWRKMQQPTQPKQ